MQVYSLFADAVNSIDINITYWEYPGTDNIFDRNAMLIMAAQFDTIFNEEGCNYYLALPDGRIKLILTEEDKLMTIFRPYAMPESWQPEKLITEESLRAASEAAEREKSGTAKTGAAPMRRFCQLCGNQITPNAAFCSKCGAKLK